MVRKCKPGSVYNIGGNDALTIGDMLDYMISLSPIKNKIEKQLDTSLLRPFDVTLQLPCLDKFNKAVPEWKPKYNVKEIIEDVLNGWREKV